jgi:hypothetical protein
VGELLYKSQWLWRKNPENLTGKEQERMAKIKDKNLSTAKAYQMRLVLQDIYRSANAGMARHRFKVWCRWVALGGSFPQGQPLCLDGETGANDREPSGRNPGALEVGSDQRVHGGIEQRV